MNSMNIHSSPNIKAFGQNVMPTNAAKVTKASIGKVLSAIKHTGRPGSGGANKKLSSK